VTTHRRFVELTEEYQEKVKQLQSSCTHVDCSDWCHRHLGWGRISDYDERVCLNCNKVVEKRLRDKSKGIYLSWIA
jgi:hypothetical protein